jgi:hypothetical protein
MLRKLIILEIIIDKLTEYKSAQRPGGLKFVNNK